MNLCLDMSYYLNHIFYRGLILGDQEKKLEMLYLRNKYKLKGVNCQMGGLCKRWILLIRF